MKAVTEIVAKARALGEVAAELWRIAMSGKRVWIVATWKMMWNRICQKGRRRTILVRSGRQSGRCWMKRRRAFVGASGRKIGSRWAN